MKVFIATINNTNLWHRVIEVTSMDNIERLAGVCAEYAYCEILDEGDDPRLLDAAKAILFHCRTPGSQMIGFLMYAINIMLHKK